jgi:anti-sigma regulatory factor (Ser/Thr protein kinase)
MISPQQSVLSKLPAQFPSRTKTFPGRYASLAEIAGFVREAAAELGLDDFGAYMVETAVDEACSNIIEHAYGGEGVGDIEVTVRIGKNDLTVALRDHGRPFSPEQVPEPDIHAGLEEQPGHGLGLYLIRKWMDEVKFEFSPEMGNVLKLVKYKGKKSG